MPSLTKSVMSYLLILFGAFLVSAGMLLVAVVVKQISGFSDMYFMALFMFNATYTLFVMLTALPVGLLLLLLGLLGNLFIFIFMPILSWIWNAVLDIVLVKLLKLPVYMLQAYQVRYSPSYFDIAPIFSAFLSLLEALKGWLMTYSGLGLPSTTPDIAYGYKIINQMKVLVR